MLDTWALVCGERRMMIPQYWKLGVDDMYKRHLFHIQIWPFNSMRGDRNCAFFSPDYHKIFVEAEQKAKQKSLNRKQRRLAIKAELQRVAVEVEQKHQQQKYRERKKERES
ncbi:hypothetical protein TCON_2493, partial [Astathelohania contejeani]